MNLYSCFSLKQSFGALTMTFLMLFLFGLGLSPAIAQQHNIINVGPGPEDMVLDIYASPPRLIVSCAERRTEETSKNGFWWVSLEDQSAGEFERKGEPEGMIIHPHGVDLVKSEDGKVLLYAISHGLDEKGKEDAILIYEVKGDKLHFVEAKTNKKYLRSPNDVAATSNGAIYVSNDYGRGLLVILRAIFRTKSSTIAYFNGEEWGFTGKRYKYANGIREKNGKVYLSATISGAIYGFDVQEDYSLGPHRRIIKGLNGLDNITFNSEGNLIITRHRSNTKFLKHAKKASNPAPTEVWLVNKKTGNHSRIFEDDGTGISAGSTAIGYGGRLYIVQVFEGFVYEFIPEED